MIAVLIIKRTIAVNNYIAHEIRAFGSYRPICIPAAAVDDGVFCGNERDNRSFPTQFSKTTMHYFAFRKMHFVLRNVPK